MSKAIQPEDFCKRKKIFRKNELKRKAHQIKNLPN